MLYPLRERERTLRGVRVRLIVEGEANYLAKAVLKR